MEWLLQYHYNYLIYVVLMMIGLYGAIAKVNLVKKVIALGMFQTAVFLFYISMAVKTGGTAPIFWEALGEGQPYTNPLPHVLILTAIVVSVSTTAVALALVIAIKREYGTVEADELGEFEEL